MLLFLPFLIEFVCLSFAIFFLKKANDWWRLFIPYLICVVIIESIGPYLIHLRKENNYWIFNLYLPIYFSFVLFVLNKICTSLFRIKIWLQAIAIILTISYIYESSASRFKGLSIHSYSLANAFIVIICCSYYYHLLKQEGFIEIKKHAPFWIVTGLLFFCFGSTVSYLFFDTLAQINIKYELPVRQVIFIVLNFILYSCWSYAFICRYRQKT